MARQSLDIVGDETAGSPLPADQVRVQLLGSFRLDAGSRTVTEVGWRLRKARSLVKLLALAPGRRLHREQVLDLLWPDLDVEAAGNNLRSTLYVARRMLERPGAATPAIAARGDYLCLYPDRVVWSDVQAFEEAASTARLSGDPARFKHAIGQYGGELLPEDRYESWADDRRERLRLLLLSLLRDLATLHERRGEQRDAIDVLLQLSGAEPADEAAHIALMRLYAQTGQRLQALRQYQHLRERLQQELDVEPDPESTRLYEDILAGRIAVVAPAAGPQAPRPLVESGRPAPGLVQLPVELTSFVGREPEIIEVYNLVRRSRLVTLTGSGGSGKTRLAVEAARALANDFADGTWFVDLAPLADSALVVAEVAAMIGVAGQADHSLIEDVAHALRDRQALIVLDNCEHLVDACAVLADALLRACRSLTILATSREALRVDGEVIWPAPPLRLDAAGDSLQVEAVQLFVERARLANPHFAPTEGALRAILDICRRLDGMPLAIELAAARTRLLPVEQLAERLDDALTLLGDGARATPARQQSLRGAIDWSYALLTAEEQILFRRLSVFAGSFAPEAVEEICSREGFVRGAVLELLFHLADKSLVVPREGSASARFRMMEPLRQFALERLGKPERATLRRRHADYFLALSEQAAPNLTSPDATTWSEHLDTEHDNLRVALAWVVEHGDAERGLRLGCALWRFWLQRGYFAEGRRWMSRLLAMPGVEAHPLPHADVLFGMGMLALFQTDFTGAESFFTACLDLARASDHRIMIASAATQLSIIAQEHGDDLTAERLLEEGLAIRLELGRVQEVADSLTMLGEFAFVRSDIETAQARYEESLTLQEEAGDLAQRAKVLDRLAQIAITRGDLATARTLLERGLAVAAATPYRVPDLLGSLAQVAFDEGDTDEAARLAARCLRASLEMSRQDRLAWGLYMFATIASIRGQAERAVRLQTAAQCVLVAAGRSAAFTPILQHWIESRIEPAIAGLDASARDRAAAQGSAMTLDQAVADALADLPSPASSAP